MVMDQKFYDSVEHSMYESYKNKVNHKYDVLSTSRTNDSHILISVFGRYSSSKKTIINLIATNRSELVSPTRIFPRIHDSNSLLSLNSLYEVDDDINNIANEVSIFDWTTGVISLYTIFNFCLDYDQAMMKLKSNYMANNEEKNSDFLSW